jgi:hypothetical protein
MSSTSIDRAAPAELGPAPRFPWAAVIAPIVYMALFTAAMIYMEVRG